LLLCIQKFANVAKELPAREVEVEEEEEEEEEKE
jgi:hypothetical protein